MPSPIPQIARQVIHCCYGLSSINPQWRDSTYIGYTTNPRRRIRQHNGLINCGAKKTSRRRPWAMQYCIYGFPSHHHGLQFEWQWQNTRKGRRVHNHLSAWYQLGEQYLLSQQHLLHPDTIPVILSYNNDLIKSCFVRQRSVPGLAFALILLLNTAPWKELGLSLICLHPGSLITLVHQLIKCLCIKQQLIQPFIPEICRLGVDSISINSLDQQTIQISSPSTTTTTKKMKTKTNSKSMTISEKKQITQQLRLHLKQNIAHFDKSIQSLAKQAKQLFTQFSASQTAAKTSASNNAALIDPVTTIAPNDMHLLSPQTREELPSGTLLLPIKSLPDCDSLRIYLGDIVYMPCYSSRSSEKMASQKKKAARNTTLKKSRTAAASQQIPTTDSDDGAGIHDTDDIHDDYDIDDCYTYDYDDDFVDLADILPEAQHDTNNQNNDDDDDNDAVDGDNDDSRKLYEGYDGDSITQNDDDDHNSLNDEISFSFSQMINFSDNDDDNDIVDDDNDKDDDDGDDDDDDIDNNWFSQSNKMTTTPRKKKNESTTLVSDDDDNDDDNDDDDDDTNTNYNHDSDQDETEKDETTRVHNDDSYDDNTHDDDTHDDDTNWFSTIHKQSKSVLSQTNKPPLPINNPKISSLNDDEQALETFISSFFATLPPKTGDSINTPNSILKSTNSLKYPPHTSSHTSTSVRFADTDGNTATTITTTAAKSLKHIDSQEVDIENSDLSFNMDYTHQPQASNDKANSRTMSLDSNNHDFTSRSATSASATSSSTSTSTSTTSTISSCGLCHERLRYIDQSSIDALCAPSVLFDPTAATLRTEMLRKRLCQINPQLFRQKTSFATTTTSTTTTAATSTPSSLLNHHTFISLMKNLDIISCDSCHHTFHLACAQKFARQQAIEHFYQTSNPMAVLSTGVKSHCTETTTTSTGVTTAAHSNHQPIQRSTPHKLHLCPARTSTINGREDNLNSNNQSSVDTRLNQSTIVIKSSQCHTPLVALMFECPKCRVSTALCLLSRKMSIAPPQCAPQSIIFEYTRYTACSGAENQHTQAPHKRAHPSTATTANTSSTKSPKSTKQTTTSTATSFQPKRTTSRLYSRKKQKTTDENEENLISPLNESPSPVPVQPAMSILSQQPQTLDLKAKIALRRSQRLPKE